ncbi:MAG TPA: thrombospondin type 3 repeat-containing protein [Acidimicrobiia bacterium]|nr:thrombospondin type 3 repeat-containing protein [Acidimicrobiia bacterium]
MTGELSSRSGRKLFFPRVLAGVAGLSAVISMVGFGFLGSPAQSKPEYLSEFNSRYQTSGSRLDNCTTCHASSSPSADNLNPYGADFGAANHDFGAIEGKDSDGDGFSNVDEIKAGTLPGDPNDNPNKKPEPPKPAPTTTTTRPFPFNLLPDNLP